MLKSINEYFDNYRFESEVKYAHSAAGNDKILFQLAELTGAMLAGKFLPKKAMEILGLKPRVGFSQVTQDSNTLYQCFLFSPTLRHKSRFNFTLVTSLSALLDLIRAIIPGRLGDPIKT